MGDDVGAGEFGETDRTEDRRLVGDGRGDRFSGFPWGRRTVHSTVTQAMA